MYYSKLAFDLLDFVIFVLFCSTNDAHQNVEKYAAVPKYCTYVCARISMYIFVLNESK